MPVVIAVVNQKGGVGKTTVSACLADYLSQRGHSVVIVDSDPQESSVDWGALRAKTGRSEHALVQYKKSPIRVVGLCQPKSFVDDVLALQTDYVIIDGASNLKGITRHTIGLCSIAIIPVTPSSYDLWAMDKILDETKGVRKLVVVNRAIRHSMDTDLIQAELARLNEPNLVLMNAMLYQSVNYSRSIIYGETPILFRNGSARKDIEIFCKEAFKVMESIEGAHYG